MSNNDNNRKSPMNFGSLMIRVAAILFILTMVTIYLLGGVLARYVTTGSSSDSARVAKLGNLTITETGDFDGSNEKKGMIIPGVDLVKDATVNFEGSEMATVVFVEVILSDNWERNDNTFSVGTQLSWTVADEWTYLKQDAYEGNPRYIYYQILEPNHDLNADIIADEGKITVSAEITESNISNLKEVTISLRASVIQAGGFETVQDAWTAMAAK